MMLFILVILIVVLMAAVLYFYAFRYEPVNFVLSKVNIFLKSEKNKDKGKGKGQEKEKDSDSYDVKDNYDPALTILHLSDFHLRKDRKGEKLFKFVKNLGNLSVDFIFITGDLVEKDKNIEYLIKMLSPLKAKYGKYAIFGVHDYYNKTPAEFIKNMLKRKRTYKRQNNILHLISRLSDIGIKVLRNESETIDLKGFSEIKEVEIIGLDDPIIKKIDIVKAFEGIKKYKRDGENFRDVEDFSEYKLKLSNKNEYRSKYKKTFILKKEKIHTLNNESTLRLSLIHTPDSSAIIDLAERGVDIIFGGHTHGGQVRIPGIGALISGCRIKTKFASGLFYFKSFVLYVTRGLGEGRYSPFRFYCQPEASLIRMFVEM